MTRRAEDRTNGGDVVGDAWGLALLDHHDGVDVGELQLEVEGGGIGPAMHPEWFFRGPQEWDSWERELLDAVDGGPVLDLGCGATSSQVRITGSYYASSELQPSRRLAITTRWI